MYARPPRLFFRRWDSRVPVGFADRRQPFGAPARTGECMTRPEPPVPMRSAPRRQRSNGRIWLVIGISLSRLSITRAAYGAGIVPRSGRCLAGTGTMTSQVNGIPIMQPASMRGVIERDSSSIGRNNSVTFDDGSGATLNRVTGGSPSAILCRLIATGSMYVIYPRGIVPRPAGGVTTGGRLVASILDACNSAFMQGGALRRSGNADASGVNLGKIHQSTGSRWRAAQVSCRPPTVASTRSGSASQNDIHSNRAVPHLRSMRGRFGKLGPNDRAKVGIL